MSTTLLLFNLFFRPVVGWAAHQALVGRSRVPYVPEKGRFRKLEVDRLPTEFLDSPEYEQLHVKNKIPRWLWSPVDAVVEASLHTLKRNQVVCTPGFKNRVLVAFARSGLAGMLLKIFAEQLRKPDRKTLAPRSLRKESRS